MVGRTEGIGGASFLEVRALFPFGFRDWLLVCRASVLLGVEKSGQPVTALVCTGNDS